MRTPPTRQPGPGDLVCPACGEGNEAGRKFCRRCGTSLEHAEVIAVPWWRRLLDRVRGGRRRAGADGDGAPAGAARKKRPLTLRRVLTKARPIAALLLLVAGLVYASYSPFREAVDERWTSAKDRFWAFVRPEWDPVRPVAVASPTDVPDDEHPGAAAVDGFSNTFWQTTWEPDAGGPVPAIRLTFPEAVDVDKAVVRNGSSDGFQAEQRVRGLRFVYSNGRTHDVTLKDTPEPQEVDLDSGADVTTVELQIVSTYPSATGRDVALTEVELFTQRD